MQIERILHSQGFGSRKDCRALVRAGLVSINGEICDDPGADFDPGSTDGTPGLEFSVEGERWQFRARAYLMLHKPTGYECSAKPGFHPSVFSLLPAQLQARGVQCVGRLDQDTTGLLLLSDDGQFIHHWSSGKKNIPKRYEATLKHPGDDRLIAALLAGVVLHDDPEPVAARACTLPDPHCLHLTLCGGKYHQVKRMIAAASNRVEALHRSRIGGLELDSALAPGQWRWLESGDWARLEGA